jgi:hypothetical protein
VTFRFGQLLAGGLHKNRLQKRAKRDRISYNKTRRGGGETLISKANLFNV